MKTFQILITILAAINGAYSISRGATKRGIDSFGSYHQQNGDSYSQLGSSGYNYLINSPPLDQLYSNNDQYLKDFSLNTQNIFAQLTSHDFGVESNGQDLTSYQNQAGGGISFIPAFRGGNDNGYSNSIGLGAYGSPYSINNNNNYKFTQPVQSSAPLSTRLTSSPLRVSYPSAVVPVSGYSPAYPPYQPTNFDSIRQSAVSLGSGSLGVTRLNDGNFALGSGSIGYGGSPPVVGQRPKIPQQIPIY